MPEEEQDKLKQWKSYIPTNASTKHYCSFWLIFSHLPKEYLQNKTKRKQKN